jgi:hypothetical protein
MSASVMAAILGNPQLFLAPRHIFLLSHMRANTSLFGHLMGSHPQVEGYYEMHIGYYSWKSLWRQKLRHFSTHEAKPGARWMFDKILHDGHHVAPALLRRNTSRAIFMVRRPEQSIKSLVALYRRDNPNLPEASAEGATRYYIDRLASMASTARALGPHYYYLDAECLISQTDDTLAGLSNWLGFETPIPSEYETFANTGRGNTGDNSSRLKSGKISRKESDYSAIELSREQRAAAEDAYHLHRGRLIAGSAAHALD